MSDRSQGAAGLLAAQVGSNRQGAGNGVLFGGLVAVVLVALCVGFGLAVCAAVSTLLGKDGTIATRSGLADRWKSAGTSMLGVNAEVSAPTELKEAMGKALEHRHFRYETSPR